MHSLPTADVFCKHQSNHAVLFALQNFKNNWEIRSLRVCLPLWKPGPIRVTCLIWPLCALRMMIPFRCLDFACFDFEISVVVTWSVTGGVLYEPHLRKWVGCPFLADWPFTTSDDTSDEAASDRCVQGMESTVALIANVFLRWVGHIQPVHFAQVPSNMCWVGEGWSLEVTPQAKLFFLRLCIAAKLMSGM